MGKVVAQIKLTNYLDLELKRLKLRREKPRAVQTDALVDTGATRLYLKRSVIKALGLKKEGEVVSKTTNGTRRRAVYQAARLDLMAAMAPSRLLRLTTTSQIFSARYHWNTSTWLSIRKARN